MKIMFISFTYYPNRDGVQKVTQYQAEGLAALGYDVTLITSDNRKYIEKEVLNGVSIVRVPIYKKGFAIEGDRQGVSRMILDYCDSIDVLISVCPSSYLNQCILNKINLIKCKKIGIVHGIHESGYSSIDFSSMYSFLKKTAQNVRWWEFYLTKWQYLKQYDAITHLHEMDYSLQFYKAKGYTNNHILYNAADDDFFVNDVTKEKLIVNVGTYNLRKNQIRCLETFYESNLWDYTLVLIGPEKNEYYCRLLKKKGQLEEIYGKRNVKILCDISRTETIEYIKRARIYLLTSTWEAFPVSIVEAMSAGAAFVSTNVGIVRYFPGGVVCENRKDLVSALEHVAKNFDSYSVEARKYAEKNFVQANQVKKLEDIILGCKKNEGSICK